jgi:hypothetical protein
MILDVLVAILSGILSTITIWSLKQPLTINSVYIISLTTLWMIFFMSIVRNDKYYFTISIIGLIITYYIIHSQMFVSKSQLYNEIINNHEKLIMMSTEVLDNSGISEVDKRKILDIIREEKERLNLIKNRY